MLAGFQSVAKGEPLGLLFVVWGAAGFVGTLTLWAVVFGRRAGAVRLGLLIGLIANLPVSVLAMSGFAGPREALFGTLIFSPALVAVYWLIELSGKRNSP